MTKRWPIDTILILGDEHRPIDTILIKGEENMVKKIW